MWLPIMGPSNYIFFSILSLYLKSFNTIINSTFRGNTIYLMVHVLSSIIQTLKL